MQRSQTVSGFTGAFFDGFSFAGLFAPMQRPGAPTQLFADVETVERDTAPAEVEQSRRSFQKSCFEPTPHKMNH